MARLKGILRIFYLLVGSFLGSMVVYFFNVLIPQLDLEVINSEMLLSLLSAIVGVSLLPYMVLFGLGTTSGDRCEVMMFLGWLLFAFSTEIIAAKMFGLLQLTEDAAFQAISLCLLGIVFMLVAMKDGPNEAQT